MKRDRTLTSLSRDHHQALFVAQRLRRSNDETAGDACAAFLAYWSEHGRGHFRAEEEVLLPAFAAHGDPYHPFVARALCDRVIIRQQADALARDHEASAAALHALGGALADHVRLEERELFVLIEQQMPAAALARVAVALEHERPSACG